MKQSGFLLHDKRLFLPSIASIILYVALILLIIPQMIRLGPSAFIFYLPFILVISTLIILIAMFYAADSLFEGSEEIIMSRALIILSLFSVLVSVQHELMLFGLTCPHTLSMEEVLEHIGIILSPSVPPIAYAMSVFLIRERWKYLAYALLVLVINIVIMFILLPFTL